jgi:cytochrome c-type biogenesis protein
MSLTALGLLAAFGAGILSFVSPCVLPLLPGYLAYAAGSSVEEAQRDAAVRWRVSASVVWFVLGVILLLTLLGAAAAVLGSALNTYQLLLERIGGVLLIVFGVVLTGLIPIPWLSRDHLFQVKPGQSSWRRSVLMGLAFAASWSACSSPILAAILVVTAVRSVVVVQGILFMLVFALGESIPLLLVGLLVGRAGPFLRRIQRYTVILYYVGAVVMIFVGISLVFGLFSTSA